MKRGQQGRAGVLPDPNTGLCEEVAPKYLAHGHPKMFEKTLQDLVKGLRDCKTDAESQAFISKSLAEIKEEASSREVSVKSNALLKAVYVRALPARVCACALPVLPRFLSDFSVVALLLALGMLARPRPLPLADQHAGLPDQLRRFPHDRSHDPGTRAPVLGIYSVLFRDSAPCPCSYPRIASRSSGRPSSARPRSFPRRRTSLCCARSC